MNYTCNRNYGCRMKEITLKGCRSLIIENDVLQLLILLDKGADIVEFIHKKTDMDFMWRSPAGYDLLTQGRGESNCYVGGWFECFPNAGDRCNHKGMDMPFYGDVRHLPWEYSVQEDSPELLKVRLFVNSNVLPLKLERILTVRLNTASVLMEERATNLSDSTVEFTWGHHPNIGAPFLNENCRIELPEADICALEREEDGKLKEVFLGKWPYMEAKDGKTDLRPVAAPQEGRHELVYLKNLKGNWAAVRDSRSGLGFALSWDSRVFGSMLLWRAFDAREWRQVFGHLYILCFLLKSSHYSPVADAAAAGMQLTLRPGETLGTWLEASVFEGAGNVFDISQVKRIKEE